MLLLILLCHYNVFDSEEWKHSHEQRDENSGIGELAVGTPDGTGGVQSFQRLHWLLDHWLAA